MREDVRSVPGFGQHTDGASAARKQSPDRGLILPQIVVIFRLAMSHPLIRRIFVLLLAVFVTAGMGLSAVQASTMNIQMMDMAPGMELSGSHTCDGCGSSDDSKGMGACVMVSCTAPALTHGPLADALDLAFAPVHHPFQMSQLQDRHSSPDPYPPRTSDIG